MVKKHTFSNYGFIAGHGNYTSTTFNLREHPHYHPNMIYEGCTKDSVIFNKENTQVELFYSFSDVIGKNKTWFFFNHNDTIIQYEAFIACVGGLLSQEPKFTEYDFEQKPTFYLEVQHWFDGVDFPLSVSTHTQTLKSDKIFNQQSLVIEKDENFIIPIKISSLQIANLGVSNDDTLILLSQLIHKTDTFVVGRVFFIAKNLPQHETIIRKIKPKDIKLGKDISLKLHNYFCDNQGRLNLAIYSETGEKLNDIVIINRSSSYSNITISSDEFLINKESNTSQSSFIIVENIRKPLTFNLNSVGIKEIGNYSITFQCGNRYEEIYIEVK